MSPMPDAEQPGGKPDTQALEQEIVRLNKVVRALMDRAESVSSAQGSDYGLFQTTVMLQRQVRLRTEEVQAALRDNELASSVGTSASADMHNLRRTAALQIQLLELVVQQKDIGELIDRVAELLDMRIVLFDTRGHALCRSPSAAGSPDNAPRLWAAYAALQGSPDPLGRVGDAGERFYYRDIVVLDRVERVLAAVASHGQPTELAAASLSFLQQLATLDVLRRRDELTMRRRARRTLLRDVLAGDGLPDELATRLREQGVDQEKVWRIIVVEPAPSRVSAGQTPSAAVGERLADDLLRAVDTVFDQRRIPFLSLSMGSLAVVLSTFPDAEAQTVRALLDDLREEATRLVSLGQVVVGCSAPLAGVASAPRSLKQAQTACLAARREPSTGGRVVFDELSGQFRLMDGLDEEALADIVRRTFAPLHDYDARHHTSLYETLHTLFEHHLAVQETADALYVHRNTLQKRLAHVEQLLGVDLGEIDDVVDIQLGLHAADLLGTRPA
jgi:sugar diacid utilization regulator